ncbi:hypothetical protein RAD16_12950 [Bradyrhizobium sp. 18BD]
MPLFEVSICFCTPGATWHLDTSRDVTTLIDARDGVQAVRAALEGLEYDERAELVHFIHVSQPKDGSRDKPCDGPRLSDLDQPSL